MMFLTYEQLWPLSVREGKRGRSDRFLARGGTVKTYEQGIAQRTIVAEFDSVEQAIAAHDSPAYQAALAVLGNTGVNATCVSSKGVDGS
jgi:uncharacterized protein (DUF1330 family)